METSINTTAFVSRVLVPRAGDRPQSGVVQIGFFLEDTLTVMGTGEDEDKVIMKQTCYEQKIVSMASYLVDNEDYVQQVVYQALHDDMHVDLQWHKTVCPRVTRHIIQLAQETRNQNPSFAILSIEIRLYPVAERPIHTPGGPHGEHGYDRLLQRLSDVCGVCDRNFDRNREMVISTCHHAFHRNCLLRWFDTKSTKCPVCRLSMIQMLGHPIPFDP